MRPRGVAAVVALLAAFASGPLHAQDWATPDFCALPDKPRILPEDMPFDIASREVAVANGTGRLWRIETADGRVSHLWGTVHASARPILDLPDAVVALIEGARVVATEIDMQLDSRAEVERLRRFDGFWEPSGYVDRQDVPPDVMAFIYDRAVSLGYAASDVDAMTDGGLLSLLLSSPCEDFFNWAVPVQDNLIVTLAHMAGASIAGLEPNDRMASELTGFWAPAGRAMVTLYGSALDPRAQKGAETAFGLYLAGRIGAMMVIDEEGVIERLGPTEGPRVLALADTYLLTMRNLRFVDNAMPMITEGGAFLAVGAFHLPRDDGMIALLRDRGLTVTRVTLPGEVP
jgi:uncharacterized protein